MTAGNRPPPRCRKRACQIISTCFRGQGLKYGVGQLNLWNDDSLSFAKRIWVRFVTWLFLRCFDGIGQQLGTANQVSRGHLFEPPTFAGGRPRMFANGVASDTGHVTNLHVGVLACLSQFDGEV